MSKLPDGWGSTTLEEVANIVAGNPDPQGEGFFNNGSSPFVRVQDMGRLGDQMYLAETKDMVNDTAASNLTLFPKGSVLFTKSGASTLNNQRAILKQDSYVVSHIGIALPYEGVSNKWIYYALKQVDFGSLAHGGVMPSLPLSKIKAIPTLLPPTNEQYRIIEKLEVLFADLDRGVAELKAAQVKLGQYRQSLLKSAVDGSLTETWRKENADKISETGEQLLARILKERRERWEQQKLAEFKAKGKKPPKDWQKKYPESVQPDTTDLPDLPEGWVWATLDQLSAYITSGSRGWAKYYSDSGAVFIRAQNIKTDALDLNDIAYVDLPNKSEGKRTRLSINDILLTITGANVGKCAFVREHLSEAYVSQHVALLRMVNFDLARFVHMCLVNPASARGSLTKQAYGAGKPGLNLEQVASTCIPLPCLSEIAVIIQCLASENSKSAAKAESLEDAVKLSESQQKNILKAAFSGELVPQDPNDEPATVLLERIRNQRKEAGKPKRTQRKKVRA